jgi:hypothetical protein
MFNSIEYNHWKSNIIEEKISEFLCELGSDILRKFLEWLDEDICKNRNKNIYRYKEKRERTINTTFYSVAYQRRYYSERISRNETRAVFLLDEILDIELLGKLTFKQAANLANEALAESFRNVRKQNDKPIFCNPSHQTVKNRVADIGEILKKSEIERIQKYFNDELEGKKQVEILFEEKDGLFLSIQGENSKKEIKLAKVYEGWQLETNASKRYKTVNTVYFAGYEKAEQFDAIVNSGIAKIYDTDYLKTKILNGDGAEWISKEVEMDAMAKLLCLNHSNQDLLQEVEVITKRNIDKNIKYDVKYELDNELKKAKKDVNDAVRGLLYEKPRKFSNKDSHIKVFDNKLTQLFRALHSLL